MRSNIVIPVVTGLAGLAAGYGLGFYTAQPVCDTFAFIGMIVVALAFIVAAGFALNYQQRRGRYGR